MSKLGKIRKTLLPTPKEYKKAIEKAKGEYNTKRDEQKRTHNKNSFIEKTNRENIIAVIQGIIAQEGFVISSVSENSICASKKGGLRKKTLLATGLVGGVVAGFHAKDETISVLKSGDVITVSWNGKHAKGIAKRIKREL